MIAAAYLSHSELAQVMVQVFVHPSGPRLRCKRPKERMRVLGAAGCALVGEISDRCNELGSFALKVTPSGICRE